MTTDIQGRSQTSYAAPHKGVVSHGAQIGGLRVFADHTRKKRLRSSRTRQRFTHLYLHAADHSRCRWHTHLTNHGYFDYGKNPKTPIWASCRIKMAQVLGAPLYICENDGFIFKMQQMPSFFPCILTTMSLSILYLPTHARSCFSRIYTYLKCCA